MPEQDQVKPLGRGLARRARIRTAVESHWLIAQRCQYLFVPEQPLRVNRHHHYSFAVAKSRCTIWQKRFRIHARQPYLKSAANPRNTLHMHRATVFSNDVAGRRQPQAIAVQPRGKERLEQPRLCGRVNASTQNR